MIQGLKLLKAAHNVYKRLQQMPKHQFMKKIFDFKWKGYFFLKVQTKHLCHLKRKFLSDKKGRCSDSFQQIKTSFWSKNVHKKIIILHFIILALYIFFKLIKIFKRTDFC